MPAKPPRLHFGDVVGLIAPASAPPKKESIDRSVAALERLGFQVKLGHHVRRRLGFLAGTDRERAADVMRLFEEDAVKAIFCVRGGYGAGRILERLDYECIREHPKIMVGYSDITVLHMALLAKSNLVSFHGPMLSSLVDKDLPDFTTLSLLNTIMYRSPTGSLVKGYPDGKSVLCLRRGVVRGGLVGGNLSVLCTIIGTPFQPSFRRKILFFEEVNEAPYRVDRYLTFLWNAGVLRQVAGVAVGICKDCEDPGRPKPQEYRQSLLDVLKDRLLPLKVPVLVGLPFGHVDYNATLPVGGQAVLNASDRDLTIIQAAVR